MRRSSAVLAFMLLAISAWPVLAEDEMPGKHGEDDEITVALRSVDMGELIDIVQRETGYIFLYSQNVENIKQITFQGTKSIPRKALFSVFKSILETRGFGLTEVSVKGVRIFKIVEARRVQAGSAETFSGEELRNNPDRLPHDDTMVTVVYPLKYAEARTAMQQLNQIINRAQGSSIVGIPNVNVLIVTAFGSNMQRIFRIVELLDVPGPQPGWKVVKLQYADPEVVASKVESVLQTVHMQAQKRQLQAQPPGKLLPEPRTRSLIVQALPEQFPEILSLIKRLDVELENEPSLVHVIRLKHTNAEDMADTVNAILQANPDIGPSETSGESVALNGDGPPIPKGPTSSRQRRTARVPRSSTSARSDELTMSAIPDKATNSLIVVAPDAYFEELKRIIDRLDVRRPQVLIECVIVEISSAQGLDVGTELAILDKAADGSTRGFGATQFGLSNIVDQEGNPISLESVASGSASASPGGRLPTWSSSGMSFGIMAGKEFKIPILLTLLGSESDVNVLSLPRILTNENEEAEIKVSEAVPTAQAQSTAASTSSLGFAGFEEAGITLTITPHISENSSLRLKINQVIEQFSGTSTILEAGGVVLPPAKTTREIKNEVTVPSHRTVILGGLTSTVTRETESKIPLLGDIPLIGHLFKRTQQDVKKRNLFVFITPHILDDPDFRDLERISDASLNEAKAMGVNTSEIDRHYRLVSRHDRELDTLPEGRPAIVLDYASPLDEE